MANKHYKEVQILADSELVEKLAETQLDLTKTRFDQTISGNVTPKEIRDAKKNIARINTEIRSREVAQMTEGELAKRSKIRYRRSK
ncbi:MAG: 50S ribosomal protein L29 [Saprospiraceae bacterium]|jgi:large subunit ribosomal protein L29|uniref:50S ribosomal protein L29 n=1 Tax=Candidatus Brachybacter algidus TaxID=2982024 RepID=UPI001B76278D|nr:50S ribosomal protein L29 [Candidatus Brachybacter algidus]MBP7304922.1 50S ribosomal protein L29 [Saprospiraceae bacterium]MBK6374717.1 50S ribosomal protein L29 [Candidatus Brachybacter algidus]MBK6449742.1 50S ribosomal protein L29 [Candidatus Brachybacter algidus]MBK7604370.1 50S ribosomal protein L29 [Candidatus Brachybacter algidus]MBK8355461.1 50S ribosomal protein L29 [Candidatus Brachybacter algidus]